MKTSPTILNEAKLEHDALWENYRIERHNGRDAYSLLIETIQKSEALLTSYTARLIEEMEKAVVVEKSDGVSILSGFPMHEIAIAGWNTCRDEVARRFQAFKGCEDK